MQLFFSAINGVTLTFCVRGGCASIELTGYTQHGHVLFSISGHTDDLFHLYRGVSLKSLVSWHSSVNHMTLSRDVDERLGALLST